MADFHGASGLIAKKYAACMLPINNVNEKIFVFLWCLFMAVAACSGLLLIYRFLTIVVPSFRTLLLKKSADMIPETKTEKLMQHCHFGDWFILRKLSQNMDFLLFNELIRELSSVVESHRGILPFHVDQVRDESLLGESNC
jgi:innexin